MAHTRKGNESFARYNCRRAGCFSKQMEGLEPFIARGDEC
jgi:hypothetical protein